MESSKAIVALESYIWTNERFNGPNMVSCRVRWLLSAARNGDFTLSAENVRKVGEEDMADARLATLAGDERQANDCVRMARAMRAVANLLD